MAIFQPAHADLKPARSSPVGSIRGPILEGWRQHPDPVKWLGGVHIEAKSGRGPGSASGLSVRKEWVTAPRGG